MSYLTKIIFFHLFFIPTQFTKLQSEEDPVDILPQLRQDCLKTCPAPKANYEACVKRIESKGEGDCEAWYFDMLSCVDKCVAPKIFKYTK